MALYQPAILSREIRVPMHSMGGNISSLLERSLRVYEGKCAEEGYVKKGSIKLHQHSCGILEGTTVRIQVVFECKLTNPLIGQLLMCVIESNTKAGIKARLDDTESPFIVFLARDHHYQHPTFSEMKEGTKIPVKIIGKRYGIHEKQISILAVLDETYIEPPPLPVIEEKKVQEDKLVFMYKSKDVYPGKGVHEHIHVPKDYEPLSKITQWRSQLSNLDMAPFIWSGKGILPRPFAETTSWNSIEHAFQGAKFKFYKFDDAERFTLNSDDMIGKGDGSFAQKHAKLHTIKDTSEWDKMYTDIMQSIATAKYSQHKDKMRILSLTNDAQLFQNMSRGSGSTQVRATYLEEIRAR